jgi:hypothetical protein
MKETRNTATAKEQAKPPDYPHVGGEQHSDGNQGTAQVSHIKRRLFISHKSKDKKAAEEIRGKLKDYGGDSLHVFISERIDAGQEWSAEIRENLENADYLLLLYTDPSEEWDWCLFEAGFFAGGGKGGKTGLVCLHSTRDNPPKPLQQWQSVRVDEIDKMSNFLKKLFTGIHSELVGSPEKLQTLATQITDALLQTGKRKLPSQWITEFVTVSLDPAQVQELNETGRVPGEALCGLEDRESVTIFGIGRGQCTIGRLEEGLEEHYREWWLKGLGESLRAASLNRTPIPRIPILYSLSTEKDYHVILHRVDRFSDESVIFCLLFVERIPENRDEQTPELRLTGDMLKLARSFRWKILTRFRREISVLKRYPEREEQIKSCLDSLKCSMDWVAGEATRLDLLTPDDVIEAFEDQEDKEKIEEIITKIWPTVFSKLNHGIETQDLDEVLDGLNGMLRLNKDYMVRSAGRYQQLLEKLPEV